MMPGPTKKPHPSLVGYALAKIFVYKTFPEWGIPPSDLREELA